MERRKFLIGTGALASGSAAAVGTGAFTNVSADRSVSVDVADDASAYLSIEPQNTANGEEYASVSSDGTVELDFSGTDTGASGLNRNAETTIRDILRVRNQGTQDIIVGVSGLPNFMSIYTDDGTVAANGKSTSLNQDSSDPGSGNLALVQAGEVMSDIGVIFRLKGEDASPLEDFNGTLTFNAIAVSELDDPEAVRNAYDTDEDLESDPETGTGDREDPASLVTANVNDGSTSVFGVTINTDVYPEWPANSTSYQVEVNVDVDTDGLDENPNDDLRIGYGGAEVSFPDLPGGYINQNSGTDGSNDRQAFGEIDGLDVVESSTQQEYTFTVDWEALADNDDISLVNDTTSEFQVNEVFITDGGGVFGEGLDGQALGVDETYSTE